MYIPDYTENHRTGYTNGWTAWYGNSLSLKLFKQQQEHGDSQTSQGIQVTRVHIIWNGDSQNLCPADPDLGLECGRSQYWHWAPWDPDEDGREPHREDGHIGFSDAECRGLFIPTGWWVAVVDNTWKKFLHLQCALLKSMKQELYYNSPHTQRNIRLFSPSNYWSYRE